MIAGGVGEVLFETNIFFGSLNSGVAQGDLDLFEGVVALVGEFGEGAAEVVGRDGQRGSLSVGAVPSGSRGAFEYQLLRIRVTASVVI